MRRGSSLRLALLAGPAVLALLARAAQAAPATGALETTSGAGAADCPDATRLAAIVNDGIGRTAVVPAGASTEAPMRIGVAFDRTGKSYTATVRIGGASGGTRKLSNQGPGAPRSRTPSASFWWSCWMSTLRRSRTRPPRRPCSRVPREKRPPTSASPAASPRASSGAGPRRWDSAARWPIGSGRRASGASGCRRSRPTSARAASRSAWRSRGWRCACRGATTNRRSRWACACSSRSGGCGDAASTTTTAARPTNCGWRPAPRSSQGSRWDARSAGRSRSVRSGRFASSDSSSATWARPTARNRRRS